MPVLGKVLLKVQNESRECLLVYGGNDSHNNNLEIIPMQEY